MKILISSILVIILLTICGCSTLKTAISAQPEDVKYYRQNEKLFDFQGAELTLKAPTITKTMPDGTLVTEPIMKTVTKKLPDGTIETTKEPIQVNFWVRHTGAKPPLTFYDVLSAGLKVGLAWHLGGEAIAGITTVSEIAANKQPLVVESKTETDYLTIDGDGEIGIDRN